MKAGVRGWIRHVGASTEHGNRAPIGVHRAAMGRGIDAKGHAADDNGPGPDEHSPHLCRDSFTAR